MDRYTQNDTPEDYSQPDAPDTSSNGNARRTNRNNWHTKKVWSKKYPIKANEQRYRHRRKKRSAYNDYQRRYMAARRALLKARRLEEMAGYGEV